MDEMIKQMVEEAEAEAAAPEIEVVPDEEAPVPEPVEEPAKVALTKEEIATALGVEVADLDKVKNLKKWERDLNRISTEHGKERKEQKAEPVTDEYEVTDEQAKMLKAIARKGGTDLDKLARIAAMVEHSLEEQFEDAADEFFSSHKDVEPDVVFARMQESGVRADLLTSPKQLKRALDTAYKAVRADAPDDFDARLEEAVKKKLEEMAGDGVQIAEVRPKKGAAIPTKRTISEVADDPNMSFFDKLDLMGRAKF